MSRSQKPGKDRLFALPLADIAGFRFDRAVVEVFPDMIERSVPGYATIIGMTGTLAKHYVRADTRCYDLGCSLGASTIAMRHGINADRCKIIAVDNAPDMIEQCAAIIASDSGLTPVELLCADVLEIAISQASMAVMNFTLQFVDPTARDRLIADIYTGLEPGGILVLSEKIAFADPHVDALMVELHHGFKRANGYSQLEISQKRTALENVLIPETLDTHRRRLANAGFASVDVWFQCFNFVSILAIK